MVVTSEAEKFPIKVVAGADLSALIGFDKQKQMLGCSDSSCLAEIGGALGVDYLLSTEVSEVGGVWLLSTTLLDIGKANSLKRVSKKADKVRDLVELAQQATSEALGALGLPGPTGAKVEPKPDEKPAAATSATATAQSSMTTTRKAGIGLAVAGGALLVGGGVCGILALGKYNEAKATSDPAVFASAKSTGAPQALIADVLYGVGAAAAIAGIVLAVVGGNSGASASPTATLAPVNGGAAVVVSGGF
jgi:hypothetical protein